MMDRNYTPVEHIYAKSKAGDTLSKWFQPDGVPQHMVTDGTKELTHGTWSNQIKEH